MYVYNPSRSSLTTLTNMPRIPLCMNHLQCYHPHQSQTQHPIRGRREVLVHFHSFFPTPGSCVGILTSPSIAHWYWLLRPLRGKGYFLTSFKYLIKHGLLPSPQPLYSLYSIYSNVLHNVLIC